MKSKLHLLAAVLLLAAAPAFADDLLDAVLWDGPSAFPAESSPATSAPTLPSVPSVPSTSQPAAPAAPSRDDLQLRRELEEMRARTDRLEAALKQAPPPETTEPPKPARPSYDRADWLNRPRISLHGAYWDRMDATTDKSIAGAMEFACPIGETPFDAAARGFWMQRKYRFDDDWQPRHEHHKTNMGVDVWGIWLPWRRNVFSPHAGLGLRCEKINGESKTYHGWNRLDSGESYEYDDSGFSLAGRVGATVTYKRLSLKGEFIIASESSELLGEIAIRLSERIMLSGFLDRFDNDFHDEGADAGLAFGGGLTILFGHPPPAVISAMPMKNQHPRNP